MYVRLLIKDKDKMMMNNNESFCSFSTPQTKSALVRVMRTVNGIYVYSSSLEDDEIHRNTYERRSNSYISLSRAGEQGQVGGIVYCIKY